jgi:hypothetical protein
MEWGWGGADKDGMVVAHATMRGAANWPLPLPNGSGHLSWPFGPSYEASKLFVEAPVQLLDSWASCALPLFIRTCQKVLRPGPFMRTIISSSCPVRVILSFRFHIQDHYLVFISFQNVLDFFFPSLFFYIIST